MTSRRPTVFEPGALRNFSVHLRCGAFEQGFDVRRSTAEAAIEHVLDHARYMVRNGAWPRGRFTVAVAGEKNTRRACVLGA